MIELPRQTADALLDVIGVGKFEGYPPASKDEVTLFYNTMRLPCTAIFLQMKAPLDMFTLGPAARVG